MNRPKHLALVAALFTAGAASAQAYSITEPEVNACAGAFLDSGGEGAIGYSNDEDFTTTICADQAGLAISLSFVTFNVSAEGTAPTDQLVIYDGPDMGSPVLGTYTAGDFPGNVSASFTNASGCLTLHWTSNETGTGVWAASILCEVPCDPPTAVAFMSQPAPAMVCIGEQVTFNATGSVPGAGHTIIEYNWNFDDGTLDSLTGSVITHSFSEPGEYIVQITLTDDIGCQNNNTIDQVVRVSTEPVFNFTDVTQYCFGQPVDLSVEITPTTWTDLPANNLGGPEPLPDLQGVPFNSTIQYSIFAPGATLVDAGLLDQVCVSMEHSFMGDLVVQLTCPNGQTVVMHQQGGGGTYLGGANDTDSGTDIQLGECMEYCWSPSFSGPTWADATTFITAGNPAGNALQPGTYGSVQPFSQLVGCPLNGLWTFTITDLWAIDNGSICSWSLSFDPSLYPDISTFTPVLGSSADSIVWTGNGVDVDQDDPFAAVVTPPSLGQNVYSASITDNFGCTYTEDIVVTVIPGPVAAVEFSLPSPQPFGSTITMQDASVVNGSPVAQWMWTFDGDTMSTDPSFTYQFIEPGLYPIVLYTVSANGCEDSVLTYYRILPGDIIIPNVFSPNGDGENDFLEFANAEFFNENVLTVYDRWGKEVFTDKNYQNTWRAPDVTEGTYYYIFRMKDGREWTGHVTLLRN